MDVKRYVPSESDRLLLAGCERIVLGQVLLEALKIRHDEVKRDLEERPTVVTNGDVSEDWRVKLGEQKGTKWLEKLIAEIKQERLK